MRPDYDVAAVALACTILALMATALHHGSLGWAVTGGAGLLTAIVAWISLRDLAVVGGT